MKLKLIENAYADIDSKDIDQYVTLNYLTHDKNFLATNDIRLSNSSPLLIINNLSQSTGIDL